MLLPKAITLSHNTPPKSHMAPAYFIICTKPLFKNIPRLLVSMYLTHPSVVLFVRQLLADSQARMSVKTWFARPGPSVCVWVDA